MPFLNRLIVFLVLSVAFSSCGPDYIFQKKYTFDSSGWVQSDTLVFSVPIIDTLRIYNLYLDVDHTDDYAYQNMYIRIHTTFPDQQKLIERVSISIENKSGQWNGECKGKNCHLRVNIQEGAFFNRPGEYTFMIEQFMRHDTLEAISGINFMIEDTGESRSEKAPQ